ncbi:hypothetical protein SESBI_37476 [Sesbania bispinosa]|nr:hypothetical protein SESBI_37476 [Sesbania bispinosa]
MWKGRVEENGGREGRWDFVDYWTFPNILGEGIPTILHSPPFPSSQTYPLGEVKCECSLNPKA